ncbi:MAG: S1C family serine protease, partial [Phycisphaerae bacterium]
MTPQPSVRFRTLLLLTVGLAALLAAFGDRFVANWAYALERGKLQATADELETVQDLSRAFRGVAKLARPGVVQIRVSGGAAEELDPTMLEELRRRLNLDEDELQQWLRRHGRMTRSSGSGVLLDNDGYILTNNHVVGGRREIRVRLHDDREFDATLVGADPKTDLAVIRIEATNLHALPFGDSDAMEVGDFVLAIGAPFGLGQTVTHGIISAKGRNDISDLPIAYQDFLQTDAAINP